MVFMNDHAKIDYSGARGSNTGDDFHELWALSQCLRLLDSKSGLKAVKVEGTESSESNFKWESSDCTLYFGGDSNSNAERVEIQQLKYSAANPSQSWTTAKISKKKGKSGPSTLRGLAQAFNQLRHERKKHETSSIRLKLITNQKISPKLVSNFNKAKEKIPPNFKTQWKSGDSDLHRLIEASGLCSTDFHEFSKVIDFVGSTESRFAIEEKVHREVSEWADVEFVESTLRLRRYISKRMMPESAGEIINRDTLLIHFGISDERALFPCPPQIKDGGESIERKIASQLAEQIKSGAKRICLHGSGGVGKTTILQQINRHLPKGSETIFFDCYGGGSYLDASALRHRPKEAFVQLSNEIASQIQIPFLINTSRNIDYAKAFRKRLEVAAGSLASSYQGAKLIIIVDAADNSISAAQVRGNFETSFIHDFKSFNNLPENVGIIISTRTGRMDVLQLPSSFHKVEVEGFTLEETAQHVCKFWEVQDSLIEEFHFLSGGIPRVQTYGLEAINVSFQEAIDFLKLTGKDLDEIFEQLSGETLNKLGLERELECFFAGLITLPRPIPASEVAEVLKIHKAQVRDICNDLSPGVTFRNNFIGFADEDFEDFVRRKAEPALRSVLNKAATNLFERRNCNEYTSLHVAALLEQTGQHERLLKLVEEEPEPNSEVISDAIVRQEVRIQRLGLALKVCKEAKDNEKALQFVLIGAEAKTSEEATLHFYSEHPFLSALFARDTASRLILGNPDRIQYHGQHLMQLMAEDAKSGNFNSVRERRTRLIEWSKRREEEIEQIKLNQTPFRGDWEITPEDASCLIYAELLENGHNEAIKIHRKFKPWDFSILAAEAFIERFVIEERFGELELLAESLPDSKSIFLLVPLALAGRTIDTTRLASGLEALIRRVKPTPEMIRGKFGENNKSLAFIFYLDTVLSGAEILASSGKYKHIILNLLTPFIDPEIRRIDQLHEHEVELIHTIIRSYTLAECLDGRDVDAKNIFIPRPSSDNNEGKYWQGNNQNDHDTNLQEMVSNISGLYISRSKILTGTVESSKEGKKLLRGGQKKLQNASWRYQDQFYFHWIRKRLAESMSVLFMTKLDRKLIYETAWDALGNQSTLNASKLIKLLLPHQTLQNDLLTKIISDAKKEYERRAGAEEKSMNLASYAELIVPLSPDDGQEIFQWAVEVASELDTEIINQIRLIEKLVKLSSNYINDCKLKRDLALSLSQIIEDASIRLEHHDCFPWDKSLSAISHLDTPIALSCAARWHDQGITSLEQTLSPILKVDIQEGELSCTIGLALSLLSNRINVETLEIFLDKAKCEGITKQVANEIVQDVMRERISVTNNIRDFIYHHSTGELLNRFKEYSEFKRNIPPTLETNSSTSPNYKSSTCPILESYEWCKNDLLDGSLLSERTNELLETCRAAGETLSLIDVFESARKATPMAGRVKHLTALAEMHKTLKDWIVVDAIVSAATEWKEQPAVSNWCKEELPTIIACDLGNFIRYLPLEAKWLSVSLNLSDMTPSKCLSVILEGIQTCSEDLKASVTIELARKMADWLDPALTANLCLWYIERLHSQIPEKNREPIQVETLPQSTNEAVSRFIYSFLGDIDLSIRWKAAHSLRRIARLGLGQCNIIEEVVREYNRKRESIFRDPCAPFYWIAARLWLVIALDRISEEKPEMISGLGSKLYEIAISDEFPHVLIKDYARDAVLKLNKSRYFSITPDEYSQLSKVNKGMKSQVKRKFSDIPSFDIYLSKDIGKRRFCFDSLDTLSYWYNPWLRLFHNLSAKDFLDKAEYWIVDKWDHVDEKAYGSKEPRTKKRFTKHNWNQALHSHGTLPTLEHHRTYLEWNAMWCSVGEFLKTHQIALNPYNDMDHDDLSYRISDGKLTHPPIWLSDINVSCPLQQKRWYQPNPPNEEWFEKIFDNDFLEELLPSDRSNYLVVDAKVNAHWDKFRESICISSNLVSPASGASLMRALQCMESETSHHVSYENINHDIHEEKFRLKGWLQFSEGDSGFDHKDTFCNQIKNISMKPGSRASNSLGLIGSYSPYPVWTKNGDTEPSFIYEVWGNHGFDGQRYQFNSKIVSNGHRLLVRTDALNDVLSTEEFDLIVNVRVKRYEGGERPYLSGQEETKETSFERVFLLRRNGKIEGAERDFGTWREDCQRTSDSTT